MSREKKQIKKRKTKIDFAKVCYQVRTNSKMTYEEMATRLGITTGNYRKYETGEIRPGAEASFRLAGLYIAFCQINVDEDEL